jgi:hypothetical protein
MKTLPSGMELIELQQAYMAKSIQFDQAVKANCSYTSLKVLHGELVQIFSELEKVIDHPSSYGQMVLHME